jgi:catechol 2,3-dioxygenase-like lactoylglutathione lyase family enzyme
VPDIGAAVQWYVEVLGFRVLVGPGMVDRTNPVAVDVFGEQFKRAEIAHLASGNGCALELFQFVDPPGQIPEDNFAYWIGGFFHICLVDPDVAGLARRIEESGGKIRGSGVWENFAEERRGASDPYLMVYCEDPFGNILEIFSHSHEQVFANSAPLQPAT